MIQVLPKVRSFGEEFGRALGTGAGQGLSEGLEERRHKKSLSESNAAYKKNYDIDLEGIEDPAERKTIIAEKLRGQTKREQDEFESPKEKQYYDILERTYGKQFADLWKGASEGGRTALLKTALDLGQRGINFGEQLMQNAPEKNQQQPEMMNEEENKIVPKTIDYDKGLTPRERTQRQEHRYATNLPYFQESNAKIKSYESEKDNIGILKEISPQIGSIERLNINPQTGELILPALASAEAQRYVKTINDFTRNAKDSYGSRVTNFDLVQFLKRLPTLANTEEGRRQIIEQLEIINDLNLMREQALHDVIDEYGGIRNIDYDKAEQMADKRIEKKAKEARTRFSEISKNVKSEYDDKVKSYKAKAPKGHVTVRWDDGEISYIPKDKVGDFLEESKGNEVL